MQDVDIVKLIKNSFKEKNIFSVFLISFLSFVLIILILASILFYYRTNIFGYFAKEYLLGGNMAENGQGSNVTEKIIEKQSIFTQEYFIVDAVKKTNPSVVSIVISKEIPKYEVYNDGETQQDIFGNLFPGFIIPSVPKYRQNGTEKKDIGGGSGFFVSGDGLIVTNKHVVEDSTAFYSVFTNDGKKHEAKVIAKDPVLDIALIKIEGTGYPTLSLGDSDSVLVGQSVIAIGNALGEFRNTVSVGVVSGLSRSITAGVSLGKSELLDNVIQTDAAINPGNSGGPLLDLSGKVVGVNVAVVAGSQGIGFALPINSVKSAIESVKSTGKISRPYLGVRYVAINSDIQKANNLTVDYGIIVKSGSSASELAVIPGSPADKAGIVENDILLEVDGVKINEKNSLASIIRQKKIGQVVNLHLIHKGADKYVQATLEAAKDN
jgi:serine protease Do